MKNPKIGILLFYLELYDKAAPHLRERVYEFAAIICKEFENRGIDVVCSDICRVKYEFEKAVKCFEMDNVDAIVTLHLAYSPSMEAYDALMATDLPLIVLNTTPAYVFDNHTSDEEIMFNHGIHGVQDLCSVLKRSNRRYCIETGHWENSDVINRTIKWVKAACMANKMRNSKVGIIGKPFEGMGDFRIPFHELKRTIGFEIVEFDFNNAEYLMDGITTQEIDNEIELDKKRFNTSNISFETHYRSVLVGLALRKWLAEKELDAFTVNFLNIRKDSVLNVIPFLEIEKQMANGIGYAGEGDVLTAALSGTLASENKETSFTEMFCPDWKNNTIFLSHMGEMNISLVSSKPELVEADLPYTDAENPAIAYGLYKPGQVVLVNLAPDKDNQYTLILAEGEIIDIDGQDALKDSIHAWFRPECDISEFLTKFSIAGGTHHSVLCYAPDIEILKKFGYLMNWKTVVID